LASVVVSGHYEGLGIITGVIVDCSFPPISAPAAAALLGVRCYIHAHTLVESFYCTTAV
jgi:hypothetical protein